MKCKIRNFLLTFQSFTTINMKKVYLLTPIFWLLILTAAFYPDYYCQTNQFVPFRHLRNRSPEFKNNWGFFAHQRINRLAVFSLPPEMMPFYRQNLPYLTEHSVDPDKRRYAVLNEGARHFIDLETYGDSALHKLPYFWKEAVLKFTEDSLYKHGIVPWHIQTVKYRLTKAMEEKNTLAILKLSAEIGHYIADSNVPLHTTRNYNGQLTNQTGIHAFWESRLPELFSDGYDFFVGKAAYIPFLPERIWENIKQANQCLDSVLVLELELSRKTNPMKKYTLEERQGIMVKTQSRAFSEQYHRLLDHQVERQMRSSVKMIADVWFTCWVDAGQPDLNALAKIKPDSAGIAQDEKERRSWFLRIFDARPED